MKHLWLFSLLMTGFTFAQTNVRGTLINGTNDGAGSAQLVQLLRLTGTMQPVAQATDVTGDFTLSVDSAFEQGRYLVQAVKDGVTYTQPLLSPDSPVSITVFDSGDDVEMNNRLGSLAIYAYQDTADIGFFYNLDNVSNPPRTLIQSDPSFSIPLVPDYNHIEASTQRGEMPLRQNIEVRGEVANLYYPLKPGRTRLMVRSSHDYSAETGATYRIPLLPQQKFVHLLALPTTLDLEGEGLTFVSIDGKNGVKLYEFARMEGQNELVVTVTGEGSANPGEEEHDHSTATPASNIEILNTPNPIFTYRWWVIGGVLFLLMTAMGMAAKVHR